MHAFKNKQDSFWLLILEAKQTKSVFPICDAVLILLKMS